MSSIYDEEKTAYSNNIKSDDLLNSSISVNGRAGAVFMRIDCEF